VRGRELEHRCEPRADHFDRFEHDFTDDDHRDDDDPDGDLRSRRNWAGRGR
jgi:hypothetical protein